MLEAVDRLPDLLRLVAVPALAWAARRDVYTRRVPNRLWPPLAALGAVLLAWDAWYYWTVGGFAWRRFALAVLLSVGFVIPLAYAFWWLGGFGGADAKALMTLAVLFPAFPVYELFGTTLPLVPTAAGSFAFTILTNAVLVGLAYPLSLAAINLRSGDVSKLALIGRRLGWNEIPEAHGRLLETPSGYTRNGLDLDALRMYLRWRGIDLAAVRERPEELRDPASLPETPNPPTDGAVVADGGIPERPMTDGGTPASTTDGDAAGADGGPATEDPWGAEAFLESIEGDAYGTTPETLRGGLEVLAERDEVWVSPGIPFVVPIFLGLLVALVYGDLLFGLFGWLGLA